MPEVISPKDERTFCVVNFPHKAWMSEHQIEDHKKWIKVSSFRTSAEVNTAWVWVEILDYLQLYQISYSFDSCLSFSERPCEQSLRHQLFNIYSNYLFMYTKLWHYTNPSLIYAN